MLTRSLVQPILESLDEKMVFVTGPRQTGKTTLARHLFPQFDYFNFDSAEHRLVLNKKIWDRKKPLVIFDELHKKNKWKQWLKGIYDTEGNRPRLLVTGSANLNVYRKVGDSLAGRYFQFHLHPLDLKEAKALYTLENAFQRLWNCGGFPEPFLRGEKTFYNRWKKTHLDIILRQDLLDLQSVCDIQSIESLVALLKTRVGSTVSLSNLSRELEKDVKTIKRWLSHLENLYVIFKVSPYSQKIARSLLKESKYYFYDVAQVEADDGAKLENLAACALRKELSWLEDVLGHTVSLHYLRTKDGREIDFVVLIDRKPSRLIEVKWTDDAPHKSFKHFDRFFKNILKLQLVKNLDREKTYPDGLEIREITAWLTDIDFKTPDDTQ